MDLAADGSCGRYGYLLELAVCVGLSICERNWKELNRKMNLGRTAQPLRSGIGAFIALAGLLAAAGCGNGKLATYAVRGQVLVNDKPADGANVIFCPVNPSVELKNLRPSGKTDATGAFTLMTFEQGDGAPAGDYKVLVKWLSPAKVDSREDFGGPKRPDRLRGKYYNLNKTPLTATIEKRSNELPPFSLTVK